MKRSPLLCLFFWLFLTHLLAQNAPNAVFTGCGSDVLHRLHPELHDSQSRNDKDAYKAAVAPTTNRHTLQAVRTLPVVVHIIHNGGPENITDMQVQLGIAQLNAAFNASFGSSVNTDIQFCLAQRDPNGLATNGITRDQSPLTVFDMESQDLAVKNINRWAPTCYINIWVVAAINSSSNGNGVVGYAYYPSAHGLGVDGIVMEAGYLGSSPFNTSVLTHEMGHYLGLYHTFQGGCPNNDCLLDGDRVCDTPPDQTTFSSCSPNANSCGTDADDTSINNPFTTDVPDLGEDYMDYSTLQCFSKFTPGQSERMNWHLTHVRSSLMGCLSCQSPCPAPLTAGISTPTGPTTIPVGTTVNFTASAANASAYAWNIDAALPFDNNLNTSYLFNTVGTFWVKFRAISGDPEYCTDALDSVRITVTCNAQAIFSVPPVVQNGIPVTFLNSSVNATSYEWVLDNITVSTTADLTYNFVNTGAYQLCLRAANANCVSSLCTTVYVQQTGGPQAGCDNTFIKSLSNMGGSRPNIFPHPNGDFFATGLRNDSTVIVRFDQGGTALWARAFRFSTDVRQIRDMAVDASGDLIGIASPEAASIADLKTTIFRFNLTTNTFVWIRNVTEVLYTQIHILDNDYCILTGESTNGATQLRRISKTTGNTNGFSLEGEDGDYYSTVNNNTIFGACRRYYSASGDFRASVFAHNLNTGAFQWQNSIISEGNTTGPNETRMYPEKPIIDDNSLVIIAAGDLVGFGGYLFGSSELVVAKTSLTGDVQWTRQYLIAGSDSPAATAVVATATGYYVVANLYDDNISNFNYGVLIKTDKNGIVQWAKRLGISGKNIVRNVMERNGFLYLTMSSDSYVLNDLLLIKVDQDGNTNTSCEFVQPVSVETITLPNIQHARPYQVTNLSINSQPVTKTAAPTPVAAVTYCNTPCLCPEMLLSAGNDTTICQGQSVGLQATPGFEEYHWSPATGLDNPDIINPIASPTANTTYTLDAIKYGVELINNGDFIQGNTGFTNGYVSGGIGFGTYNVTANPQLFNSQWLIPNDHSPSADNLMMMIDADDTGNLPPVWQQSVAVQPNTEYVFQLWGAMAYFANPPVLELNVNGTVVGTFNMVGGNSMVGVWQPYRLVVNSGTANQLVLILTDLNTAAIGNDFALDDISLRQICHYTDDITVSLRTGSGQILDLGPDITACTNGVHTFDAGAGFDSYLWQDGSTDQTFTAFSPGTYWVTVRDNCGGVQQDTVHVVLKTAPTLDLGANQLICQGDSVQLSYTSNGVFSSFSWSPSAGLSCALCPITLAAPPATTVYYLAASTDDGCTNLDSVTVTVLPAATVTQNIARCLGEPFIFNGHVYTQAGTYVDTLSSGIGCDSVVTTVLSVLPLNTRSETIYFCAGAIVTIGGSVQSEPGTVLDTIPGGAGCDTIVTYTLIRLPLETRSETISFCPGETIFIGGHPYTQPGVVVDTVAAVNGGCDTIVTYTLQSITPAPSTVQITCPYNIGVAVLPGAGLTVVNYALPTTASDCPCPGIALTLTAGLPPGGAFPTGPTTVCYTAKDSCGNSASCCFQVFIREEQACDVKVNGCIKYELLNITADPDQNLTYRIRVTNNCTNKLIYTAIQVHSGVVAMEPAGFSLFESEYGREYLINSPNYSPFYSIRYKSTTDSIANGQSDIFRYTLPAQAVPTYIDITTKLATQVFYEAHLNTFYCPIGITPQGDRPAERSVISIEKASALRVFPNPNAGELFVDLSDWAGENVQVRILDTYGRLLQTHHIVADTAPLRMQMPETLSSGLYLLELTGNNGVKESVRFVVQRQ